MKNRNMETTDSLPPNGWRWLFRIGVPSIVLAVVVGVGAGAARWAVGFIPGIQGMLFGAVLGWLAGRRARREDAVLWSGGQRFWLCLDMVLTCGVAALVTLSILHAPPLAAPLEWLGDVSGGYAREPFLGVRAINPIHGMLGGGWWIGFNALDLVLSFFLGIVTLGATVLKRVDPVRATRVEDETQEEGDDDSGPALPSAPLYARRFLIVQWVGIALILGGLSLRGDRSPAIRFDPAAIAHLEALTGRFVFEDGRNLLTPGGTGGAFIVQVWGGNGLFFRSDPDGVYGISLDGTGRDFRGRMYRGSSMFPVRVRFSQDGRQISLAGKAYRMGQSLGEVEVVAWRVASADGL